MSLRQKTYIVIGILALLAILIAGSYHELVAQATSFEQTDQGLSTVSSTKVHNPAVNQPEEDTANPDDPYPAPEDRIFGLNSLLVLPQHGPFE